MAISPIELDQTLEQVRAIYVNRRRDLFPKYSPSKARYRTIWERAAEWCLTSGVTPENLVRVAFETYTPYPQPNHLLSSVVRSRLTDRATAYTEKSKQLDELKVSVELNIIAQKVHYGFTYQQIIEDENSDISFLMRFSIAIRAGLTELALQMRNQAKLEIRFCTPRYVELLFKGIEQWVE